MAAVKLRRALIFCIPAIALLLLVFLFAYILPLEIYNGSADGSNTGGCSLLNFNAPSFPHTNFHVMRGELGAYRQAQHALKQYYDLTCDPSHVLRLYL